MRGEACRRDVSREGKKNKSKWDEDGERVNFGWSTRLYPSFMFKRAVLMADIRNTWDSRDKDMRQNKGKSIREKTCAKTTTKNTSRMNDRRILEDICQRKVWWMIPSWYICSPKGFKRLQSLLKGQTQTVINERLWVLQLGDACIEDSKVSKEPLSAVYVECNYGVDILFFKWRRNNLFCISAAAENKCVHFENNILKMPEKCWEDD